MTALPEELREHVETVKKGLPRRHPAWETDAQPSWAEVDAARDALLTILAHLSRQHELLREAEEALDMAEEALARLWVTLPDHVAVRVNEALHESRSWLALYREQEER